MTTILKRELGAHFSSATAYVVMAVYFFFAGINFNYYCISANSSSLSNVFANMFMIILFLIPIITMKTFSEEKKQKTDQALFTAPTTLTEIVLGKFLGSFALYAICTCIFWVYTLIIACFTAPQWSQILCTFIGILLLGGAMIAINVLISALTESMVVAAVVGMGVGLIINMWSYFKTIISVDWLTTVIDKTNFFNYYESFTRGILSFADIVFFLSVTALFLFLTVRVLERRRWS